MPPARQLQSLTEDKFFQEISQRDPGLPAALQQLIVHFAEVGIRAEFGTTLTFRGETAVGLLVTLGFIDRAEVAYFYPARAALVLAGLGPALKLYLAEIAALVGGEAMTDGPPSNWCVKKHGKLPKAKDLLAHGTAWRDAAIRLLKAIPQLEPPKPTEV